MVRIIAVQTSRLIVAMLCVLVLLAPVSVWAQAPLGPSASLPDPLTPATIDSLVSRLSDTEVRDLLLQELGKRAEAAPATPTPQQSLTDSAVRTMRLVLYRLGTTVAASSDNFSAIVAGIAGYAELLGPTEGLRLGLALFAAALAGIAVDRLYSRWLRSRLPIGDAPGAAVPAFPGSIPILARRLFDDASGAFLALFAAAVILVLALPERETRVAMTIVIRIFFFPRVAWTVLSFFLSPGRPELRLVDADERTARILVHNLVAMILVVGLVQTARLVMQETGAVESAASVGIWVNLLIFVWLALTVIRCRDGLRQMVRGGQSPSTPFERWVVAAYPAFALAAIAVTWIAGMISGALGNADVMREGRHFISLGLLLVAPMCDTLIRATVRLVVPPMRGTGAEAQKAFDDVWRGLVRIARVIVFGSIILALSGLWGMPLIGFAQDGAGDRFGEKVIVALLILLVGYILAEVVRLLINRRLANEHSIVVDRTPDEMEERGPAVVGGSTRLGTILPPINWILQAAILVITLLTALGHLGINITALMAGAGVAGIAVGFGAQKLVADVVSGFFFLMDDAFRINEYIGAGDIEGTVEKITLQSMHLRKSDGAVHCVPYSSLDTITNFSRDWGVAKFVFTVPFDTSIEVIRKIFKRIGQDLAENPEYRDAFLAPFKFKGVSQVNDVGIVVRGKFMFKPELAKQFLIKREIYARVQAEFAKAGIQFARREVRVSVSENDGLAGGADKQSIAAAAAEAAQPALPKS